MILAVVPTALLSFGAIALVPTQAALAATAQSPHWAVQKSPDPSGNGTFEGVDCPTATVCVAVGSYYDHATMLQVPLAAAWHGKRWAKQPTPVPVHTSYSTLDGVSCPTRRFCMAVGDDVLRSGRWVTVAEVWRNHRWSIVATPRLASATDNTLQAVSCPSTTACVAVGYANQTALAERWNGKKWTVEAIPRPAGFNYSLLYGLSCIRASWCMATGYSEDYADAPFAFTEVWDGKRWSIHRAARVVGSNTAFMRVSCTSSTRCAAAGGYGDFSSYLGQPDLHPLVEHWNGKAWKIQSAPDPKGQSYAQLVAISCSAAHSCMALGEYRNNSDVITFAESWHAGTWRVQPTVNPSTTNNSLFDVSCTAAVACTAVGGDAGPGSVSRSLVERSARKARRDHRD